MCVYAMISRWLPNLGQPAALHCAAIDGDAFANFIVIPDFETRRLAAISHILRRHANRTKRKESVVRPDLRRPLNRDMRHQMAPFAHLNSAPITQ